MGAGGCFLILYTDSIYEEVLKLNTVAERNFVASLEISTTKGDFLWEWVRDCILSGVATEFQYQSVNLNLLKPTCYVMHPTV